MNAPNEMARLQSYDDLCARIWHDRRFPSETRELALAMAWVLLRDPARPESSEFWAGVRKLVHQPGFRGGRASRLWRLVEADAPQYKQADLYAGGFFSRGCEAPRLRAYRPRVRPADPHACLMDHHPHLGKCRFTTIIDLRTAPSTPPPEKTTCGASATITVTERDLVTGWARDRHFCRRHADHAQRVSDQIKAAGEPPAPIPNTGGLLPCYYKADWEKVYSYASEHWKPPTYGVCADDWPTAEERREHGPRRLILVPGGVDGVRSEA